MLFCNDTFGDIPDAPNADWIGLHNCTNLVEPISEVTEFLKEGGINRAYETPNGMFTFNSTWDANDNQIALLALPILDHEQPYDGTPMITYVESRCAEVAAFDENGERF